MHIWRRRWWCFPGGFGTLDEMFEMLTLAQTQKLAKKITVVIYGSSYWKSVINLEVLAEKGAIGMKDLELFHYADTPEEAFEILKAALSEDMQHQAAWEKEHALPSLCCGRAGGTCARRADGARSGHREDAVELI